MRFGDGHPLCALGPIRKVVMLVWVVGFVGVCSVHSRAASVSSGSLCRRVRSSAFATFPCALGVYSHAPYGSLGYFNVRSAITV